VSPDSTRTRAGSIPKTSAAIWAKVVS
jgi:hypothetical protein